MQEKHIIVVPSQDSSSAEPVTFSGGSLKLTTIDISMPDIDHKVQSASEPEMPFKTTEIKSDDAISKCDSNHSCSKASNASVKQNTTTEEEIFTNKMCLETSKNTEKFSTSMVSVLSNGEQKHLPSSKVTSLISEKSIQKQSISSLKKDSLPTVDTSSSGLKKSSPIPEKMDTPLPEWDGVVDKVSSRKSLMLHNKLPLQQQSSVMDHALHMETTNKSNNSIIIDKSTVRVNITTSSNSILSHKVCIQN